MFQFKQFTVWQERCAMKVTADACVFGALLPVPEGPCRVLDIGTGTGLLSLMIAQRCPEAMIDAVELDEAAAGQAAENAGLSPFAARIRVIAGDARTARLADSYDLVVSNPPFFSGGLRSEDARTAAARHDDTLNPVALARILTQTLSNNGLAAILLPLAEHLMRVPVMEAAGLHLRGVQTFFAGINKDRSRVVGLWARQAGATREAEETLTIYQAHNQLTPEATELLRPFYLFD